MEKLFMPVKMPEFETTRQELSRVLGEDFKSKGKHAFNVTLPEIKNSCPIFADWLIPRLKSYPRLLRFYVTPPRSKLGAHIDGYKDIPSPFSLNIPVMGCENTHHIFYDCDKNNQLASDDRRYLEGFVPKDSTLLTEIERKEIISPCFVRNDIMHGVENNTDYWRVMFTVRWQLHPTFARIIADVFDIEKC